VSRSENFLFAAVQFVDCCCSRLRIRRIGLVRGDGQLNQKIQRP